MRVLKRYICYTILFWPLCVSPLCPLAHLNSRPVSYIERPFLLICTIVYTFVTIATVITGKYRRVVVWREITHVEV